MADIPYFGGIEITYDPIERYMAYAEERERVEERIAAIYKRRMEDAGCLERLENCVTGLTNKMDAITAKYLYAEIEPVQQTIFELPTPEPVVAEAPELRIAV